MSPRNTEQAKQDWDVVSKGRTARDEAGGRDRTGREGPRARLGNVSLTPGVKTDHRRGFQSVRLLSPMWGGRSGAKGMGGIGGNHRAVKISWTGPGWPSLKDDSQGSSVTHVQRNGERDLQRRQELSVTS